MNDAAARQRPQSLAVVEERVLQGAVGIAGARMDHQPGRLVHHQDGIVFVDDIKGDCLRLHGTRDRNIGPELDRLAADDAVATPGPAAVDGNSPLIQPPLELAAREVAKDNRQGLIQALARLFGLDNTVAVDTLGLRHVQSPDQLAGARYLRDANGLLECAAQHDEERPMRRILMALMIAALVGCGSNPTPDAPDGDARELYRKAKSSLENGAYQSAIEQYETLQSEFPFGPFATQAQLDLIFAYHKRGEPESAIAAADRFLKLNPRHEEAPYALYMRGISRQERNANVVQEYASTVIDLDRAARDPQPLEAAFEDFSQLVEQYPDSRYVFDAKQRMRQLRELLAEHDLGVAQFYRERESWIAVANRAKRILERYPETPAVSEALKLLRTAYAELELSPLRRDVERVLKANGIDPASVHQG
jgi:outer membrane protein assembly factor BamD